MQEIPFRMLEVRNFNEFRDAFSFALKFCVPQSTLPVQSDCCPWNRDRAAGGRGGGGVWARGVVVPNIFRVLAFVCIC